MKLDDRTLAALNERRDRYTRDIAQINEELNKLTALRAQIAGRLDELNQAMSLLTTEPKPPRKPSRSVPVEVMAVLEAGDVTGPLIVEQIQERLNQGLEKPDRFPRRAIDRALRRLIVRQEIVFLPGDPPKYAPKDAQGAERLL